MLITNSNKNQVEGLYAIKEKELKYIMPTLTVFGSEEATKMQTKLYEGLYQRDQTYQSLPGNKYYKYNTGLIITQKILGELSANMIKKGILAS